MTETPYKKRPLHYRQWRQIRKEMYQLVLCIALLVAAEIILDLIAVFIRSFYGV